MRAHVSVGADWPPVICGGCLQRLAGLRRDADVQQDPTADPGGLWRRYQTVDVVVTHEPCGCQRSIGAGEQYTLWTGRVREQTEAQPMATCGTCQRPPGRDPGRGLAPCEHFTLLAEILVPADSWLVGWPPWQELSAGDYWVTVDRPAWNTAPEAIACYRLWRGRDATLLGAAMERTVADGARPVATRIDVAAIAGLYGVPAYLLDDDNQAVGCTFQPAEPAVVDDGWRYNADDAGVFDTKPNHCWRCCATEVDPDDVIGLCPPCLADLKGRHTP